MRGGLCCAALIAVLARSARAQCTLPDVVPPGTGFVPGQTAECEPEGALDDGDTCTVQCNAGQSQAVAGTYEYECTGGTLTVPEPQCVPCAVGEFNPTAGAEQPTPGTSACTDCPDMSTTLATGADAITLCLCVAGHESAPDDLCTPCGIGEYKADTSADACSTCPEDSTTAATGSISITLCLCEPGHSGSISTPESLCTACEPGTYNDVAGPVPATCDDCAVGSYAPQPAAIACTVSECFLPARHTHAIYMSHLTARGNARGRTARRTRLPWTLVKLSFLI
jgi:hypothetical protein